MGSTRTRTPSSRRCSRSCRSSFKLISVWLKWESIVLKGHGLHCGRGGHDVEDDVLVNPGLRALPRRRRMWPTAWGRRRRRQDASTFFDGLSDKSGAAAKKPAIWRTVSEVRDPKRGVIKNDRATPGTRYRIPGRTTPRSAWVSVAWALPVWQPLTRATAARWAGTASCQGIVVATSGRRSPITCVAARWTSAGPPGAYAQVVRRSGGYAAMHGTGANRHLHVVRRRGVRRRQMAGGTRSTPTSLW